MAKRKMTLRKLHSMPAVLAAYAAALLLVQAAAAQETERPSERGSDSTAEWIDSMVHWTVRTIEVVGITTIVIGAVAAICVYLYQTAAHGPAEEEYHRFRSALGRSILLGLEFLVAADIINTVAIDPTLESVAVLAAIVLVRTFLSFALEVEIDGKWPWRKGQD